MAEFSYKPARIGAGDLTRLGTIGIKSRPMRAVLAALGISIGIAAMVAVVGLSTSGKAQLERQLATLGTNLLTVSTGKSLIGESAPLPDEAPGMIGRIAPVTAVSSTGSVPAKVYRSDKIPSAESGGLAVLAVDTTLPKTLGVALKAGSWLNKATSQYPAVVLGATTAAQLGIDRVGADMNVWLGNQMFTVVGILAPSALAPELDTAAMVGWSVAEARLNFDGHPTTIYTRTTDEQVANVRQVLAQTANPAAPAEVTVSRPSDALEAKAAADETFTGLLLGVGAVALLVGGIGIANTMVISVLERRGEIGLRRALGATRGHIRLQFLSESLVLSLIGGVAGVILGVVATTLFATASKWPVLVPAWASVDALISTLIVGAIAGWYPSMRAARLAPSEALTAP